MKQSRARLPLFFFFVLINLLAGPVYAACTNPAGNEADVIYNGDYSTYQFCNGTSWFAYGGGGSCAAVAAGYSPTTPSAHGYFVLSHGTHNGNLGGLAGADALCLTDLTTNTGWQGYATANSNGQLIASKVHAFLCHQSLCNNLMPLTTYFFANGQNGAAGGASFTTDGSGNGPNDNADWAAANYFSGTYNYWTGARIAGSSTVWPSVPNGNQYCSIWTDGTSGGNGFFSTSANTDANRFNAGQLDTCNITLPLICFVNP